MRADEHPTMETLEAFCREHLCLAPDDGTIPDLAAIGVMNGAWRNSPLEDWHAEGRIGDADMFRTNVATTKLVRPFVSLDAIDTDAVFETLTAPDRLLPTGATVAELAGEGLEEMWDHVEMQLMILDSSAERDGGRFTVLRAALHGGLACSHWWGTPWWPDIVREFIEVINDPDSAHWTDWRPYSVVEPKPSQVQRDDDLMALLLDRPENLTTDAAGWCLESGIGDMRHVVEGWRTEHAG